MPREVIVVTGSSGLIGSAVIHRLSPNYHIAGFDNAGAPYPPAHVEAISVDLTSDRTMDYAFDRLRSGFGTRIASVVHLAAYYNFAGGDSDLYEEVTVKGTKRLLDRLQAFEVEQFIFSSTMLVHAPCQPGQHINEDWPMEPKWAYPQSKVKTEAVIHQHRGAIPAINLRIAGVYADDCRSIPLAHQIQRIYERQFNSHFYPANMSHGQSLMHLEDLVEAIELAVKKRKELPAELTLILGEEEPVSYADLQHTFAQLIHLTNWKTFRIPKLMAKVGAWLQGLIPGMDPFIKPWMIDIADDHFALDISRARQFLGWQPKHSLRQTLPKMISALKTDPAKWYRLHKLKLPRAFPI